MTDLLPPVLQVTDKTHNSLELAIQYRQLFMTIVSDSEENSSFKEEIISLAQHWTSGDFFLAYGQQMDGGYWYLMSLWMRFLSRVGQLEGVVPPLKGSVKQIKWAFYIRERCLSLSIEEADYSNPQAKYWIENWIKNWQHYGWHPEEPF